MTSEKRRVLAAADEQKALIAALQAGAVTGVGCVTERIDTHLSHIFLTETRAYKLHRSVRMAFVNLTTLEARKRASEGELDANAALAAELYVRAGPVVQRGGRFVFSDLKAPAAEIVDWVVEMNRFDADEQLDRLAAKVVCPFNKSRKRRRLSRRRIRQRSYPISAVTSAR